MARDWPNGGAVRVELGATKQGKGRDKDKIIEDKIINPFPREGAKLTSAKLLLRRGVTLTEFNKKHRRSSLRIS
jgi:hypothetical protein